MRKIFSIAFLATALSFASCEGEFPGLGTDDPSDGSVTVDQIASINKQITAIQTSLNALLQTDTELRLYIGALQESGKATGEQIAALQTAQSLLAAKITAAEQSIDQTRDWVSTSFATLEQYNALSEALAEVKNSIPDDIPDMEQITASLDKKIEQSAESMKSWINEKLSGYCTLAQAEAELGKLQTSIDSAQQESAEEIQALREQIVQTKEEITAAYKKAIEEAIANGGGIDGGTATDLTAVNKRIDDCIETFAAKIAAIESRIEAIEQTLERLLERIQSVSFVPTLNGPDEQNTTYVIKNAPEDKGTATFNFLISPKSAIDDLEKVWQSALSIKTTVDSRFLTRAIGFVELPVTGFSADRNNGMITVTASGENLRDDYWHNYKMSDDYLQDLQRVGSVLLISDGENDIVSDFIDMEIKYDCELYIDTDADRLSVPSDGGSYTIDFRTNYAYELYVRSSYWSETDGECELPVSITRTQEGGTIEFTVPKNPDTSSKQFNLSIRDIADNHVWKSITVSQEAMYPFIEVEQTEISMPVRGGTQEVFIKTNRPDLIQIHCYEEWIMANLTERTEDGVKLEITVSPSSDGSRVGQIQIHNNFVETTIMVCQGVL